MTYIFSKDGYWVVAIVIFVALGLFSVRMPFLDVIPFSEGTAAILVDQRTSNIATIISMTLAVVGLLLSNLAFKEGRVYRFLFIRSYMYPIIYYILSVIGCLIIISTLRNTLSPDWFNRLVLSATYLVVAIPFMIGYLFRKIIIFASSDLLMEQFKEQYLREVKSGLYLELLSHHSKNAFLDVMKQEGLEEYRSDWGPSVRGILFSEGHMDFKKDLLVTDVSLSILKSLLKKYPSAEKRYFIGPMTINEVTDEYDSFIWPAIQTEKGKDVKIMRCLKVCEANRKLLPSLEMSEYFLSKLDEYRAENKPKKEKELLDLFDQVIELKLKHGLK